MSEFWTKSKGKKNYPLRIANFKYMNSNETSMPYMSSEIIKTSQAGHRFLITNWMRLN